jgi:peptide/nickel transport system ATP-binding protein
VVSEAQHITHSETGLQRGSRKQGPILLDVEGLSVEFVTIDGRVRVLNEVSLDVRQGEIVGIVGESGSGKTTLGLTIPGLIDSPPAYVVSGSIFFEGRNLLKMGSHELTSIRGTGIGMVLQESLAALNPVYNVETQIRESLLVTRRRGKLDFVVEDDERFIIHLLKDLCIEQPELVLKKYPHELSGGMRKRVAIAMSVLQRPKLLILDEPTTGLDAYVQDRMLSMLKYLNKRFGVAMLLITHDLALASRICERLYVMYAGRVMETGGAKNVLEYPLHPYTRTLVSALPTGFEDSPPLPVPLGEPPDLKCLPKGCKFEPRCERVMEVCRIIEPPYSSSEDRVVKCWLYCRDREKHS